MCIINNTVKKIIIIQFYSFCLLFNWHNMSKDNKLCFCNGKIAAITYIVQTNKQKCQQISKVINPFNMDNTLSCSWWVEPATIITIRSENMLIALW